MTSAANADPDPAPTTDATAKSRRRMTSTECAAVALIFFLLSGALIIWAPLWQICFPLWGAPILLAVCSLVLLVKERRGGGGGLSRRRVVFVAAVACVIVAHALLGADRVWFRCGVELRLWRVGGRERVESWVAEHVKRLRADWDRLGGDRGLSQLPQDQARRFFWVYGDDRPAWLAPLAEYLPPRVELAQSSGPSGINFSLSGWDHGWGLNVYGEPNPDAARRARWISRLSDRSVLWGSP